MKLCDGSLNQQLLQAAEQGFKWQALLLRLTTMREKEKGAGAPESHCVAKPQGHTLTYAYANATTNTHLCDMDVQRRCIKVSQHRVTGAHIEHVHLGRQVRPRG